MIHEGHQYGVQKLCIYGQITPLVYTLTLPQCTSGVDKVSNKGHLVTGINWTIFRNPGSNWHLKLFIFRISRSQYWKNS